MSEPVLVAQLAGRRVAIPASKVGSVVELGELTPVPRAPPHVAGLFAVRSRALTVIDCRVALGLPSAANGEEMLGIEVELDGHPYALKVEGAQAVAEQMGEASEVPGGSGDGWSRVARGMVETAIGPALLIDVSALIDTTHFASEANAA